MRKAPTIVVILHTLLFAALPFAQAQETARDKAKGSKATQSDGGNLDETRRARSATADKVNEQIAAENSEEKHLPASSTLESVARTANAAAFLSLILFVGTIVAWITIAVKLGKAAKSDQLTALATGTQVQNLPTLAQIQSALTPVATAAQITISQTALETRFDTLRMEVTHLSEEVAGIRGRTDSVLNLVGRILPGSPPQISAIVPSTGKVGSAVVILGNNFQSGCVVWFGTVEVRPSGGTDTSLRVAVPEGLTAVQQIFVQGQNGVSSSVTFTVG